MYIQNCAETLCLFCILKAGPCNVAAQCSHIFSTFTCSLAGRTYSLWGWMMKRTDLYTNPLYRGAEHHREENQLMIPPTAPHFVRFWLTMYNR